MDRPWISALRFTADPELAKASMKIPPKPTVQESLPPFYDKNKGLHDEKYEKILALRNTQKEIMTKTGFKTNWNNFRNKNDNIQNAEGGETEKYPVRRPRSRQSCFAPVALDFELVGNVNNVSLTNFAGKSSNQQASGRSKTYQGPAKL